MAYRLTSAERRAVSLELRNDLKGWVVPRAAYRIRFFEARIITYDHEFVLNKLRLAPAIRKETNAASIKEFGWPIRILRIMNDRRIQIHRRMPNGTFQDVMTTEEFGGYMWLDRYIEKARKLALQDGAWLQTG